MKPWLPILIAVISLMTVRSDAQDIHWTLFEYASLNSNPAQTGAFYGTYRIGGIVRDSEFGSQNNQGGVTNVYGPAFTITVDGPIIRGFRKQDWVGVGAAFYTDGAGDGDLSTSLSHISAAYHLALDKKQRTVLTFGLQGGMGSRRFRAYDNLRLQDGGIALNSTPLSQEVFNNANVEMDNNGERILKNDGGIDVNFGVLLKTKPNKNTSVEFGLVGKHLYPYRYGFDRDTLSGNTGGNINQNRNNAFKLGANIGLQFGMDYRFNKEWSIRPAAQFQIISGAKPYFQLGAMMGYKLDPKKDMILKFGPGYRVGDAAQLMLGFEKGPIRAGASYDMNLGDLTNVSPLYGGGVEIAVSYIGTIFKQPDLKPVIICPRY